MEKKTVLVVDDEKSARFLIESQLKQWSFDTLSACDGAEALRILERAPVDLIISDQKMPNMDGLALLKAVKERWENIPFIMLTAHGSIDKAVASIRSGAYDYIQKPYVADDLAATVKRALEYHRLNEENRRLRGQLRGLYSFQNIVTRSPLMMDALRLAERVAAAPNTTVLICGESGTGKEVLARAIHYAGDRLENSFVAVNCAAVPAPLLESELFGHVKGAFSGADRNREGKFALAQRGTLLMDEVGDMPLDIQVKILRVLQERVYESLGSDRPVPVDCRIIAATHKDIAEMVREGRFREDLFHRINVFPIFLPPLRERKEDIPLLAEHFLERLRSELGKHIPGISEGAMEVLVAHYWPGNIRELRNCLERAAIITDGEHIGPEHLTIVHEKGIAHPPGNGSPRSNAAETDFPSLMTIRDAEKIAIQRALAHTKGRKVKAASILQIDFKTLVRKMKEYGL